MTTKKDQLKKVTLKECYKLCLLSEKDKGLLYRFLVNLKDVRKGLRRFMYTNELEQADILVIYVRNEAWGWNTIKTLRSQPQHFLKPILLIGDEAFPEMEQFADKSMIWPGPSDDLLDKLRHLQKISERLRGLADLPAAMGETNAKKVMILRYLYSRPDVVLRPKRNFQSSVGYSFPMLQYLFGVDAGTEVSFVQSLEEAQLLNAKLLDKMNVCPHCQHTQINFRELCPDCRSLNINEETTIHHFRCAYVGKESEFRRGTKLNCPKCSQELRHIGVDYDKPSSVLWCNECNHNFSDPLLSCFCLVCGNSFAPEDAFIKHINECSLSQEGYRSAEEGTLPGFGLINILKKELGFYKSEVFMEYLRLETSRCRRYGYHSTFAKMNLASANELIRQDLLRFSRKFRNEFASLVNETFRTTDLFTDLPNGEVLVLFTNTDLDNAKTAFSRLNNNLSSLLEQPVDMQYNLVDLTTEGNELDTVWERFN